MFFCIISSIIGCLAGSDFDVRRCGRAAFKHFGEMWLSYLVIVGAGFR